MTIDNIAKHYCEVLDVSYRDITSGRRYKELIEPKQLIAYALRQYGFKYDAIARTLGLHNHATIIHSINKVETHLQYEKPYLDKYENFIQLVKADALKYKNSLNEIKEINEVSKDLINDLKKNLEYFMELRGVNWKYMSEKTKNIIFLSTLDFYFMVESKVDEKEILKLKSILSHDSKAE